MGRGIWDKIKLILTGNRCSYCKKEYNTCSDGLGDIFDANKCSYCKRYFCENCVRAANHKCKKAGIMPPPGYGVREIHHADGRIEASS